MQELLILLRVLDSPFVVQQAASSTRFTSSLYKLALRNKVVLRYLSKCINACAEAARLYRYHRSRFCGLLSVLFHVANVINEHGFDCVIFKTLKPFEEDVADVDVLCLSDDVLEYEEFTRVLASLGYVVMERGSYCTTFMDARKRYVTELMIDVYREVSVGPLVYLDKRILRDRVTVKMIEGHRVKALDAVGELLVTIAHSLLKEREVKLVDYLSALYFIHSMDVEAMNDFTRLARSSKLAYGARLFLSLVAYLHGLAYRFVPGKVVRLAEMLGGLVDIRNIVSNKQPPYELDARTLGRLFCEKLADPVFRTSIAKGLGWFTSSGSWARLAHLLTRL